MTEYRDTHDWRRQERPPRYTIQQAVERRANDTSLCEDEIRALQQRVDTLTEIVGFIAAELPEATQRQLAKSLGFDHD